MRGNCKTYFSVTRQEAAKFSTGMRLMFCVVNIQVRIWVNVGSCIVFFKRCIIYTI